MFVSSLSPLLHPQRKKIANISSQSNALNWHTLPPIDLVPISQFVIYTLVNVPINIAWQNAIEAAFPGSRPAAPAVKDGEKKKKPVAAQPDPPVVRNTIIKFLLDQTVGAAFNIPLFLVTIGLLQGQNVAQVVRTVQNDGWDIYKAGLKLWPAVSLTMFAAVPAEHRVIFGSLAGVGWNIYLSLKTAGKSKTA
jgi:protein Mpv17